MENPYNNQRLYIKSYYILLYIIQGGHWKIENPLIIFSNKVIKNLKNMCL